MSIIIYGYTKIFNINELTANINAAGGLAKASRFSILIANPKWNKTTDQVRLIQYMGDSSDMPGLTFATNDVKNLGYGPTFKLPHTPIYDDINTTIMCDQNGIVIEFFHKWMQNIININSNGTPETSGYNNARMFAVQYPSNYVTTISIITYNDVEEELIIYTLNDAYPLRIGQPQLSWGEQNSIIRLPVTFTFKTWTSNMMNPNDQILTNSVSSFNPFATTISGSLFNTSTYQYMTFGDVLSNTVTSLVNGINYASNLVTLFK